MIINDGYMYFIKDSFFEKVNDPFLKKDHDTTKRPHYFALKDNKTSLFWLVPCSLQVDKFQAIIDKKRANNKPCDSIKIETIQGKKMALLFQDMFPVTENYIDSLYIRNGQPMYIANPKKYEELEKIARKIIRLLRRGIKFTPTQPNVLKIEELMSNELIQNKSRKLQEEKSSISDKIVEAKEKSKKQIAATKEINNLEID